MYPCDEEIIPRRKDEFLKDAKLAESKKEIVRGIKGRCFLDELISIPDDVPIDAMHQVFLGCAKSIITALLASTAKRNIPSMEKRLKDVKAPRCAHGRPKLLSEMLFWKARDFKLFLFHFGSYCLKDFVEDKYHQSFNQLSVAIRLLSLKEVSTENINEAENLIEMFQLDFVNLYGKDSQSFNFHSLRHLCDQVSRKGPLWRNSAFAFESANHFLLNSVQGTVKSLSHVVDNFLLRQKNAVASSEKFFDDRFTAVAEDCRKFSFIECGPGHLRSRHCFTPSTNVLASLAYTRLLENWSECITQTMSGDFVLLVVYHQDVNDATTAIVKHYRSKRPLLPNASSETFYFELSELDDCYSLLGVEDLLATRLMFLSGTLEKAIVSLMNEGFEHN